MHTKRLYTFLYVIIGLVIMIVIAGGILYKQTESQKILEVSNKQLEAQNPNLTHKADDEYFELVGFGELEINDSNPYINLINPSKNQVYLSFDVIYNDEQLYSSNLIEPGKMEQYNIYECLDAGEHTLTYSINVYDINNKEPLWTGIQQEQELIIKS